MPLHAGSNHGARYPSYRCTSMFCAGISSHNVSPQMQTEKWRICKSSFCRYTCQMVAKLGFPGGYRYDKGTQLCQISTVYL